MENLRIVLIVIASLIILAFLINGFKTNKKESQDIFDEKNKAKHKADKEISKKTITQSNEMERIEPKFTENPSQIQTNLFEEPIHVEPTVNPVSSINVTETDPLFKNADNASNSIQEPIIQLSIDETPDENKLDEKNITLEQSTETSTQHTESNQSKSDALSPKESNPNSVEEKKTQNIEESQKKKSEIIILYVTGFGGKNLEGTKLLSSIIQLGFKFGDMNIYHRHMDPAGNEPILFSLCNMIEPATFNPDTIHELKTPGVAIFMQVPSHGDSLQNFKLMLQAAQQIAEVNNGQVLDDKKHLLTPEAIKSYQARIKATLA